MADSTTPKLGLTKPEVGSSADTWGAKLNADLDTLDGLFDAGPYLALAKGGTGAGTAAAARANLGLGSMATQDAAAVSVGTVTASGAVTAPSATIAGTSSAAKVGAGVPNPTNPIEANGIIESKSGGFKFPDGSTQSTAATAAQTNMPLTDQAGSFTAAAAGRYRITGNNVTVTLPAAPADGAFVVLTGWGISGCVVARNGKQIGGFSEDMTVDRYPFTVQLIYSASAGGWSVLG
jgi:hypothetical protein